MSGEEVQCALIMESVDGQWFKGMCLEFHNHR